MNPPAAADWRVATSLDWLTAILLGCGLAALIWRGLLSGGGLVGGDTYPYFFPQKQVLADAFAAGELPLWNDRTSLGYPMHGESQAGVFYPPNQILYRLVDINTAYSCSVLLHYALAFVFAWRFCRSQKLTQHSALLAATVFVYGWFPVRVSLEWSIIGGVWFPLSLWMTDRLLQQCSARRWACLALCLGIHLLAGHFTLAFITQLTCLGFAVLSRIAASRRATSASSRGGADPLEQLPSAWRAGLFVGAAIAAAVLVAAIQLVPTLELRQLSQRDGSESVFDPAYGHMPPVYLTQLVASWWFWHTEELATMEEMLKYPFLMSRAGTNPVEAHLYIGLIPLCLVLCTIRQDVRRYLRGTDWIIWGSLSVMAIVYSFAWLVPVFRHVPGFGFFMGPGRYTMIAALGLSLIAGLVLDVLQRRQRKTIRGVMTALIGVVTLVDVLASSQFPVCNALVVSEPPIVGLKDSWVATSLQAADRERPVRLLAGGPNIANLYGVSSVPEYLGLGPAEYFSPEAALETQPAAADDRFPSSEQMIRLRQFAVTHLLTSDRIANLSADCELVASGPDSFLNRVWARGGDPCFLYRVLNPRERVSVEPASALAAWSMFERRPGDVRFQVELTAAGRVEFCDLMYPGWELTIDDQSAVPLTASGFGRIAVVPAGTHVLRWLYRPRSFRTGVVVSVISGLLLVGALVFRRRRNFNHIS